MFNDLTGIRLKYMLCKFICFVPHLFCGYARHPAMATLYFRSGCSVMMAFLPILALIEILFIVHIIALLYSLL